jgi:hypothetical protein
MSKYVKNEEYVHLVGHALTGLLANTATRITDVSQFARVAEQAVQAANAAVKHIDDHFEKELKITPRVG